MSEFDYIIIGAGSAGCVMANRLSANENVRVCLIEAGPTDRSPYIHIPVGTPKLWTHPKMNWLYWTTEQKNAANRKMFVPRGKVIGGSSSINGMVYLRGHRDDYDGWAEAGNRGWSYREILPYFLRSEDNQKWRNSPYHGTNGPLSVNDPDHINGLMQVFFDASASNGIPHCPDFNVAEPDGYGLRQITQRKGRRASTAMAFLRPVRHRKNLEIISQGHVNRVLLTGRRATGVELSVKGETQRLAARREIIVAAGVIGSPLILNRSGIGHGEDLTTAGVEVIHDLKGVGYNYQDHVAAGAAYTSPTALSYGISLRTLPQILWAPFDYLLFRRGLLAMVPMTAAAFVKSSDDISRPDYQFIFVPALLKGGTGFPVGHGYGITVSLLRPKSRGCVKITDSNPLTAPSIDPNYLSDSADVDLLLTGLRRAFSVLDDPAFDKHRGSEVYPGDHVRSDEQLIEFIHRGCHSSLHPVGTCKMGIGPDAVVDPELRVHGIEGLRVADASIMPTLISGSTNAPSIMIGEKASDLILGNPALPALDDAMLAVG